MMQKNRCPTCHKEKKTDPGKYRCTNCHTCFTIDEKGEMTVLHTPSLEKTYTALGIIVRLNMLLIALCEAIWHKKTVNGLLLYLLVINAAIYFIVKLTKMFSFGAASFSFGVHYRYEFNVESRPILFFISVVSQFIFIFGILALFFFIQSYLNEIPTR